MLHIAVAILTACSDLICSPVTVVNPLASFSSYFSELGDLLRCMLAYDPRHRCTTGQALSTLTSLQQSLGMGSPIVSDVLPDYCVDAHLTAALTRVTALLDDWSTSPDRPALLSAASAVSTCVGFSFTEDSKSFVVCLFLFRQLSPLFALRLFLCFLAVWDCCWDCLALSFDPLTS